MLCYRPVTELCPILQSHELQLIRLPYPSVSPGICSNACPLSNFHILQVCCRLHIKVKGVNFITREIFLFPLLYLYEMRDVH